MKFRQTSRNEEILKIKGGNINVVLDPMVEEHPVTLYLNSQEMMSIMCTPNDLEELALGFFYIKGMIRSYDEISTIRIEEFHERTKIFLETKVKSFVFTKSNFFELSDENIRFISDADEKNDGSESLKAGWEWILNKYEVSENKLLKMMDVFSKESSLFIETGGAHSIGLYQKGEKLLFYDDVSRYNTYNKLFGGILKSKINLDDKMLLTTGRIPREVLSWIINEGIGCILSISVPTHGSVLLARREKVGLMGFVRGERLNFYSPMT
ncbi:MAG: formate dehydrogenase accessory sulfurtransferase FdhD [Eubacteriaceae bacterium]